MSVLFWPQDADWFEDIWDRKPWETYKPGEKYKKKPTPAPFGSYHFWKDDTTGAEYNLTQMGVLFGTRKLWALEYHAGPR